MTTEEVIERMFRRSCSAHFKEMDRRIDWEGRKECVRSSQQDESVIDQRTAHIARRVNHAAD